MPKHSNISLGAQVLLDAGADVNQRNESVGWTAVHYASYEGHGDVLRWKVAPRNCKNVTAGFLL